MKKLYYNTFTRLEFNTGCENQILMMFQISTLYTYTILHLSSKYSNKKNQNKKQIAS